MLSEVLFDSHSHCSPDLGESSHVIPTPQASSMAKHRLSARPAHQSSRRVSIATRQRNKGSKRPRHGKYWNPNFCYRRVPDQGPVSHECHEIFARRVDGDKGNGKGTGENFVNRYTDEARVTEDRSPVVQNDNKKSDLVSCPENADSENTTEAELESSQQQAVDGPFTEELVNMFLEDWEGSTPSWEAKVVRRFFARENDEASTQHDTQAWAWLDDREYHTSLSGEYASRMSDLELRATLNQPRYDLCYFPNVDRRLIYISKLTPSFIRVLITTAWHHQRSAIRDAVCKHIMMETSIQVHIPMFGFPIFHLEFHLAYLVLRETNSTTSTMDKDDSSKKAGNDLSIDISFLDLESSCGSSASRHFVQNANISIVICGWSNTGWTGYAFANTRLQEDEDDEEEEEENREFFKPDLFSTESTSDNAADANCVEWDARRYWLRIVAIRCQLALKEWKYLVRTIEEGIEAWQAQDPCSGSTGELELDPKDVRNSLDRTIRVMQLLRTLRDTLSTTLRAYKKFDEPGGDKCYFSDIMDQTSTENSIRESFGKLADLYLRLGSLDASCKHFSTHLGRILNLESNRLTVESNKLDKESNKLSMESHSLSERTHELNVRTSVLNDKIRELNETSTKAACDNLAAAAKTSNSTRVNVELLLFTTPLGMVLQYFGSEKDIFAFDRNPKTFVLATVIVMVVLRLFALVFEHASSLLKVWPWKVPGISNEQNEQGPAECLDGIELETVQSV